LLINAKWLQDLKILKPLGHLGFTPLNRFVLLPLTHVIFFLATTGESEITILAVAETGAKVSVPP
jgi:hypothetical protein